MIVKFIQMAVLFLCYICMLSEGYAEKWDRSLLIFHSYALDYQWTEGLHQGIVSAIQKKSPAARFRVEFMDSKNFFNEPYIHSLVQQYLKKYEKVRFEGIILTDNNALSFMERFGKEIFGDVPVVACGINNASPPNPGSIVKSIIAEQADHVGTLNQVVKFKPGVETLFVIEDSTPTSDSISAEIKTLIPTLNVPFDIEFIRERSMEELKVFASTRKKTDLLYLLPFFRDKDGTVFQQGRVGIELSTVSTVPILTPWAFQLGTGVLGGRVISTANLGELAVSTLFELLDGVSVPSFQTGISVHENLYDYAVVKQFHIDERLLPEKISFLNKPPSFYAEYEKILVPAAAIIGILSVITMLLFLNLKKQTVINANNKKLMKLDKELIHTQRELVTTLGEVIEIRSKETGNHVKRVAKISRLLGKKAGMSNEELETLEAASPMHDVGKIGIPEKILNKNGSLTENEFDIIKTHTDIGKEILDVSDQHLLHQASTIAYQHHERWDGSGYPCGLKGNEISLSARITSLVDVYDALSSKRCYKEAWPEERVLEYVRSERGKAFDPHLVDIFFDNLDELKGIRSRYESVETAGDAFIIDRICEIIGETDE